GQGFAQTPHGSGLGLTIARRVVEQHGGTLHFDDTPGGGLTVRVWLPASGAGTDRLI
ncbi:MAG: ATP-binding protein, partial [Tepidimonas sp.]|nr:ATP-binding protein [Tepidimonas sp.]